jgi:hypothetical protein
LRPFRTPGPGTSYSTLRSYWAYLPLRTLWTRRSLFSRVTLDALRSLRSSVALLPAIPNRSLGAYRTLWATRSWGPSRVSLGSLRTYRAALPYRTGITLLTLWSQRTLRSFRVTRVSLRTLRSLGTFGTDGTRRTLFAWLSCRSRRPYRSGRTGGTLGTSLPLRTNISRTGDSHKRDTYQ